MDVLDLLSSLVSFQTVNDPSKGEMPSRSAPRLYKALCNLGALIAR